MPEGIPVAGLLVGAERLTTAPESISNPPPLLPVLDVAIIVTPSILPDDGHDPGLPDCHRFTVAPL